MKNVYAISYSDEKYTMSRCLNLVTAKIIGGADYLISYSPADIDGDYYLAHRDILLRSRGAGYWLWKPYILCKTLERISDGDYVIYTDAGLIYTDRISKIVELMRSEKQDVFLSTGIAPCRDWTKRDAFILMGCDCEAAYNQIMVSGGYVVLRKSKRSERFCHEWLSYCEDRRIITDDVNECGKLNFSGFREHRHDQSILSLMAYKYGLVTYKAVSCLDQPHMHKDVFDTHIPGAYGYSFNRIMELILNVHCLEGYKKSNYKRLFINTRITNTNVPDYFKKLLECIWITWKKDRWGEEWDELLIEKAKQRVERMKDFERKVKEFDG